MVPLWNSRSSLLLLCILTLYSFHQHSSLLIFNISNPSIPAYWEVNSYWQQHYSTVIDCFVIHKAFIQILICISSDGFCKSSLRWAFFSCIDLKGRQTVRKRARVPFTGPQIPTMARKGPNWSQEPGPQFRSYASWQDPEYLNHDILLCQVHIHRKLESGVGPELEPRNSDMVVYF